MTGYTWFERWVLRRALKALGRPNAAAAEGRWRAYTALGAHLALAGVVDDEDLDRLAELRRKAREEESNV